MNPIAAESGSASTASIANYLNLTEAARAIPGRLHSSTLWRWCRKGVRARSGERVRLQHVRLGGRVLTTRDWLDDFGRQLALADTAYFEGREHDAPDLRPQNKLVTAPRRAKRIGAAQVMPRDRDAELADIERELEEEGL